jgi:gluconate:H+ symporter, GntP family
MLLTFVILLLAIAFIVISSSYLKWHPFISLLVASLSVGVLLGLPLQQVMKEITTGFGNLIGNIGLVVVLGCICGVMLERSGYVLLLGHRMLQLSGGKRPGLTLSLLGGLLGIPVFCDSGYIVLISSARSMAVQSAAPFPSLSLSLASGLYSTHTLVPPTPGPIAAAGNIGISDSLGLVIGIGLLVAVPAILAGYWYASSVGKRLAWQSPSPSELPLVNDTPHASLAIPLAMILVPVCLITLASVADLFLAGSALAGIIKFAGHPIIALLFSVTIGILFIKTPSGKTLSWIQEGITQSGSILLLTGCGGAFGAVLKATPVTETISQTISHSQAGGTGFLMMAFLTAALLKTAQGSSTSSLVIASSVLAPMAASAGIETPVEMALLVSAIGAGAMTVSHANDSYFWVVAQFSGFSLKSAYRGITVISLVQGLAALAGVITLYYLLS